MVRNAISSCSDRIARLVPARYGGDPPSFAHALPEWKTLDAVVTVALRAVPTRRDDVTTCTHLDQITVLQLPDSVRGCEECLREGGVWLHLRICLSCGHVGCCDDSPGRHATAHFHTAAHPLIHSLEPGEDWPRRYEDAGGTLISVIGGPPRVPSCARP